MTSTAAQKAEIAELNTIIEHMMIRRLWMQGHIDRLEQKLKELTERGSPPTEASEE